MFFKCGNFNSDLSNWDVSNGIYFDYMFYNCNSFDANLSKWNVKKAQSYSGFVERTLLSKYPKKIPKRFREYYLNH